MSDIALQGASDIIFLNKHPDIGNIDEINIDDDISSLKDMKLKNINRLISGHLNVNGLFGKFEGVKTLVCKYVDILILTESKTDDTPQQFFIEGFSMPFRVDKNIHGGGVFAYTRDDIPCAQLKTHTQDDDLEGLIFEINLPLFDTTCENCFHTLGGLDLKL